MQSGRKTPDARVSPPDFGIVHYIDPGPPHVVPPCPAPGVLNSAMEAFEDRFSAEYPDDRLAAMLRANIPSTLATATALVHDTTTTIDDAVRSAITTDQLPYLVRAPRAVIARRALAIVEKLVSDTPENTAEDVMVDARLARVMGIRYPSVHILSRIVDLGSPYKSPEMIPPIKVHQAGQIVLAAHGRWFSQVAAEPAKKIRSAIVYTRNRQREQGRRIHASY